MKTFVGIARADEIDPLLDAGAGEFYTGYFNEADCPTQSHYRPVAGLDNIRELERALRIAHARDSRLFIAVNRLYYTPEQVDSFPRYIAGLVEHGVDGVIVSNLALLTRLAALGLDTEICLSTLQPVYNAMSLEFFRRLGITRVVLPEHVAAAEVKTILEQDKVKTEAFFHLTTTHFHEESFCLFHHRRETYLPNACEDGFCYCEESPVVAMPKDRGDETARRLVENNYRIHPSFRFNGPWNLYDFHRLGLDYLKLGTREWALATKIELLGIIREYLDMLRDEELSRVDFVQRADEMESRYPKNHFTRDPAFF